MAADFDTVFTKIKNALETYSSEQDAADQYTVYPDYHRNISGISDGAYVFLYLAPITFQREKGGAQVHFPVDVTYYLDLVVIGKGSAGTSYQQASEVAGARLRVLMDQVLTALYRPESIDLDMPVGTFSSKPFPRIEPLPPEALQTERFVSAARLTLEIGMAWEPARAEGEPLDSILVEDDETVNRWSALFEY